MRREALMAVTTSKTRLSHFWEKWIGSGAVASAKTFPKKDVEKIAQHAREIIYHRRTDLLFSQLVK